MKKLFHKVALVLGLSSIVPLAVYGIYAVKSSYEVSYKLTRERNVAVARDIAENVKSYIDNTKRVVSVLSELLSRRYLEDWQKEEILQNYRMNFREFDSLDLYSFESGLLISSIPGKKALTDEEKSAVLKSRKGEIALSDFFVSANLMPSLIMSYPIGSAKGIQHSLICHLNMLSIWKTVDGMRIGETGYPMIVSKGGSIHAWGNPAGKELIINNVPFPDTAFLSRADAEGNHSDTIGNPLGVTVLAAAEKIEGYGWLVVVEQSTKEAFRDSRRLLANLSFFALLFLAAASIVGIIGSRGLVNPINQLKLGAMEIAKGNLEYRISVRGKDELRDLAESFNKMGEDLLKYREELIKKERMNTFARLASGLVHDLKHPVQNIKNAFNLIASNPKDKEFFDTFTEIMAREMDTMERFFKDLRDVAHPPPISMIDMNVNEELEVVTANLMPTVIKFDVGLKKDFTQTDLRIKADKFVFARIINNIVSNSLKATGKGGVIRIKTFTDKDVIVEISDNGQGIPPERLKGIFDEFVTLSKGGLGLGLAVVKSMVIELGGNISMESSVGKGTTTVLSFPRAISI